MNMEKIVIVGGGSFIGNIINYIENMDKYEIVGYTDLQDHGSFWGYNYLGTDDILTKLYSTGVHNAAIGVGNKLNNTVIKQKIFNNLITIGFKLPVIKGQNVIVHKGVTTRQTFFV